MCELGKWDSKEIVLSLRLKVNQELVIGDTTYHLAEHPAAPGIPYGQEGRQAVVYQLATQDGDAQALKVFKPRYRLPALVGQATKIAPLADLPGLQVCRRTVLSARRHRDLLRQHPDLTYAVLMPWVQGPTWMEVVLEKRALTPEQSLELARALAEDLATMEEHGLAHCDLSGPNVLLPSLIPSAVPSAASSIQLVDVEQLYSSDLKRPELLPGGSPGYAHKTAPEGMWGSTADRFAGAVLLGEMLGWCDARVREAAWGENYFDPHEVQRDSDRYQTLVAILQERWGDDVTRLFERAWRSEVLADCATFGEWLVTLPEHVPVVIPSSPGIGEIEEEGASEGNEAAVRALMEVGRRLEERGILIGALENYRQAQTLTPPGSGLAEELCLILQDLEAAQEKGEGATPVAGESELDSIFDDGLAAYRREEWTKARELLAEVERRHPGYERGEQRASILLEEVEKRLVPIHRRVPVWAWAAGGLAVLAALIIGVWRPDFLSRDVTPLLVANVPAGPFLMGSYLAMDPYAEGDELPPHEVDLSAFLITRTEITNEQYGACVQAGVCRPPVGADDPGYSGADRPVVGVDWEGARAYCQWAGGDLPTEAQWEKAARGTDGRTYPWGDEFDETRANFCDTACPLDHRSQSLSDGFGHTAPVVGFWDGVSPYGAFQMAGNVWEWVLDCYDSEFYKSTAAGEADPVNELSPCGSFVVRGGSWAEDQYGIRCANRHGVPADGIARNIGFRCVFPVTSEFSGRAAEPPLLSGVLWED